ncbi:MAG: hypothetical protein KKH01_03455 [Firmicutes bacterium]|nr:hypothetical protein [Bacillota bacterium]
MSIIEIIVDFFESTFGYWIFVSMGMVLLFIGLIMFYGIKKKGKVLLMHWLLRNKQLDNELFLSRYLIQAIYTSLFGLALVLVTVFSVLSRINIMLMLLIIGTLDGLYDYFAIKRSIKK